MSESRPLTNLSNANGLAQPQGRKRHNTRAELARIAGVSEGTISKVERIERQGVPALRAMANAGRVSIDAAFWVSRLPPEQQNRLVEFGKTAVKAAAGELRHAHQAERAARSVVGDPVLQAKVLRAQLAYWRARAERAEALVASLTKG